MPSFLMTMKTIVPTTLMVTQPVLGMPISTLSSFLVVVASVPMASTIANATIVATELPSMMTTSFIRQQINLGIHDSMYQVSKQLVDIVKPREHNEFHNVKDLDQRLWRSREIFANSSMQRGNINLNVGTLTSYEVQQGPCDWGSTNRSCRASSSSICDATKCNAGRTSNRSLAESKSGSGDSTQAI